MLTNGLPWNTTIYIYFHIAGSCISRQHELFKNFAVRDNFPVSPSVNAGKRLVIITIISIIITIIVTENSNYFFVSLCFEATQTEGATHSEALKKLLQERSLELYNLRKKFCYANLTLEDLQFYTGITSKELFRWVLSMTEDEPKISLTFGFFNFDFFNFLKLWLFNRDISIQFGIKTQVTSKIYCYYLPLLAKELAFLIVWPERDTLRKNLPTCFASFKNSCVIIDCSEIYIERPSNLNKRAQAWSN